MASPVTPNTFKALIPRLNSSLCSKFDPAITEFIENFVRVYEWMYAANGQFSDAYKLELCSLACQSIPTGPCPDLTVTAVLAAGNASVGITFTISGINDTYNYSLYRATSDSGPWGAAIQTGTIALSSLVLTDATAVNGTTYFYKIKLTHAGCTDTEFVTTSATPSACYLLGNMVNMTITQGDGILTLDFARTTATAVPDGTTVEIYRSTAADQIGSLINSGVFAAGAYSYVDNAVTVGSQYFYTAKFQQAPACTEYTLTGNAYAISLTPTGGPTLSIVNNIVYWDTQPGITSYWVGAQSMCGGGGHVVVPGSGMPALDGILRFSAQLQSNPVPLPGQPPATPRWMFNAGMTLKFNCPDGPVRFFAGALLNQVLVGSDLWDRIQQYGSNSNIGHPSSKHYIIHVVGTGPSGVITRDSQIHFNS